MLESAKAVLLAFLFYAATTILDVNGHGRLIDPPSRSALWRFTNNPLIAPHARRIKENFGDDNVNCGGVGSLIANNGRCGVCGDPFDGRKENEAGGKYGLGIISKVYQQGQVINVTVQMTIGHPGFWEFRLCRWNKPKRRVTQRCLNRNLLRLTNGKRRFDIPSRRSGSYEVSLQLPKGITCSQCVLQWKHKDGEEDFVRHYVNCADIAIEENSDGAEPTSAPTTQPTTTRRRRTTTTRRPRTTTTRRPRTTTTRRPRRTSPTRRPRPNCPAADSKFKCLGCSSSYFCTGPNRHIVLRCRKGTACDNRNGSCVAKRLVPNC